MMTRKDLRGKYAIVGIGEPANINWVPDRTELMLAAEATLLAVKDASLGIKDIDGVFCEGEMTQNVFQEYTGIYPLHAETGGRGAPGPIGHVEHAIAAMEAGLCSVALVVQGTLARGGGGSPLAASLAGAQRATAFGQFLLPYGMSGEFVRHAMIARRYNHDYGTRMEDFAELAVSTRKWAALAPRAAFKDPITVEDVMTSMMISDPITILMCCPRLDYGGAFIITSAERARDLKQKPVYVLGTAETYEATIDFKDNLMVWGMVQRAGKRAFDMAGVTHKDINVMQTHDGFIPLPILELEGLGFCKPGEGLAFVAKGRTAPGGAFPMNTNGGGLSYNHVGTFGIASINETVEQLRGQAGPRQIHGAKVGMVAASAGAFSSHVDVIVSTEARP